MKALVPFPFLWESKYLAFPDRLSFSIYEWGPGDYLIFSNLSLFKFKVPNFVSLNLETKNLPFLVWRSIVLYVWGDGVCFAVLCFSKTSRVLGLIE